MKINRFNSPIQERGTTIHKKNRSHSSFFRFYYDFNISFCSGIFHFWRIDIDIGN